MAIQRCYLDYNATTPLSTVAREALIDALDIYGNPSSVHQEGRAAKALLQKARRQVAERLNADAENIVFTSGASEAAMTLLTPSYQMGRADLRFSRLYIGATEHPCIAMGGRFDADARTVIRVDGSGLIDMAYLKDLLSAHNNAFGLPLVAIQAANGETGVIQPIREIADVVKQNGGVLIVDLVQYVGKWPVDVTTFGGDFFIIAAHKIGGPKGIGAFISNGAVLMPKPLIVAGGQEKGFRSGTEALPLIASFGAAMDNAPTPLDIELMEKLRCHLEHGLRRISNEITIYGHQSPRLANTTYFSMPGLKAETLQIGFDLAGFAVSAGSACSSGKVKASSVLSAMGIDQPDGAIRVSTGSSTQVTDIDRFLDAFEKMVRNVKK
ncbi:cysteine desulfurase family protein [Bartonella sp. LJL80]